MKYESLQKAGQLVADVETKRDRIGPMAGIEKSCATLLDLKNGKLSNPSEPIAFRIDSSKESAA